MSARIGFVGGVIALSALEAVVSSRQATGRVSGLLTGVATLINHLADPTVPAIPDLRGFTAAPGTANQTPSGPSSGTVRSRLPVHQMTA